MVFSTIKSLLIVSMADEFNTFQCKDWWRLLIAFSLWRCPMLHFQTYFILFDMPRRYIMFETAIRCSLHFLLIGFFRWCSYTFICQRQSSALDGHFLVTTVFPPALKSYPRNINVPGYVYPAKAKTGPKWWRTQNRPPHTFCICVFFLITRIIQHSEL